MKNFLANFPSPDSSSSSNHPSTIDLLDDFPFSPFPNESNVEKVEPTLPAPPLPPVSSQKLPVIINTTKLPSQQLPKVVQLTKGNVVYIQAPNNSNHKSQTNFIQLTNCLPTILINTLQTQSTVANEETNHTIAASSSSMDDFALDDFDQDIDHLPMTPSTSSESPDERTTASPDLPHETHSLKPRLHRHHPYHSNKSSSSMLTNLDVSQLFLSLKSIILPVEITFIRSIVTHR